jgi:hypothetical protein
VDAQLALVLPDDGMADRQSESGRVLGGEERLEDAGAIGLGDPRAPVGELDDRVAVLAAGADQHLSLLGLDLAGVEDQVHRHLAQHHRAPPHHQGAVAQMESKPDVPEVTPRLDEMLGLTEDVVQVHRGLRGLGGVGVGQHLPHDAGRSIQPLTHGRDVPRRRLGVASVQGVAGEGEVVGHALEGVVDLVGDARGQTPHGGESLRVEQLPLQLSDAGLLRRPRFEASPAAGLLDRESPQKQRQDHHRGIERKRGAVAGPDRLGEGHDRALGLSAVEHQRSGHRPPFRSHRGFRPHLSLGRGPGRPRWDPPAGESRPDGIAELAVPGLVEAGSGGVDERTGVHLGLDHDPTGETGLLPVGKGRGQTGPPGVHRRAFLSGGAGGDPEKGHPPAAPHVDEGTGVGGAHDDAHDFGVAAEEEQEGALRSLPQERRLLEAVLRVVEAGDRGRAAQEGQVRPDFGEPALEGGGPGRDVDCKGPARLADGPLTRHGDAPEAGEVDGGDGRDRDAGQPAGSPRRPHGLVS